MRVLSFLIVSLFSMPLFAQENSQQSPDERIAISIGILQGGGSLVGADLEVMATDHLGLQIGAGFVGYGASLNYHFKPGPRSSAISLAYWHQGIGDSYVHSLLGPTFVFRAKKLFTAQLGIGARVGEGPNITAELQAVPVVFMYSIGIYLVPS